MNGWRISVSICVYYCALSLQAGLADHLAIAGCTPDFLLVSLACLGLFTSCAGGAVLGFFAGLIYGSVVLSNLATYVFSRSLAGFLAGWFNSFEMKPNAMVAMVVTLGVTLVARIAFLLVSPPALMGNYIKVTIGMAIYNAVLAIPSYLLLTRVMGKNPQRYG